MNKVILISIILSLIAQLVGFRAYFDTPNYFGGTIRRRMIFLPALIFIALAMSVIIVLVMLGLGSDEAIAFIFGTRERVPLFIIGYLLFGACINLIASGLFFGMLKILLPHQTNPHLLRKNSSTKLGM